MALAPYKNRVSVTITDDQGYVIEQFHVTEDMDVDSCPLALAHEVGEAISAQFEVEPCEI